MVATYYRRQRQKELKRRRGICQFYWQHPAPCVGAGRYGVLFVNYAGKKPSTEK